jgi:hypothetical protein
VSHEIDGRLAVSFGRFRCAFDSGVQRLVNRRMSMAGNQYTLPAADQGGYEVCY